MHVHGQDPRRPDVETRKREQNVPQHARAAEHRPRDRALVCSCLGAVALQRDATSVQTQCHAGGYVCEKWERDDEGLGEGGLVVRPGQEEVAVCFGDGADGERDQGGVGDVEGGEDAEGVGGVLLDARYWCR